MTRIQNARTDSEQSLDSEDEKNLVSHFNGDIEKQISIVTTGD